MVLFAAVEFIGCDGAGAGEAAVALQLAGFHIQAPLKIRDAGLEQVTFGPLGGSGIEAGQKLASLHAIPLLHL